MCKEDNLFGGSLLISHINETPITPQLIYGSPKMSYPYKKNSKEFLDNFIISGKILILKTFRRQRKQKYFTLLHF
jgi:hypothetical protein